MQKLKSKKNKKPNILITNDDGIDAPGIYALVKEIKKIGNVTIVAPDKQQSAVGHALTMHSPLRVKECFVGKKFYGYAVQGTPADCVKLAVRTIFKCEPDLVISGINHGSNTAISVIYSGTVSAATEGTLLGIPSLAFSLTTHDHVDCTFAAKFARKLSALILQRGLKHGTLLNVNIPPLKPKQIKGVLVTKQGKAVWNDTFDLRKDPNDKEYYWLTGGLVDVDTELDYDEAAIRNNYISITPIQYDLTDYKMLDVMKKWHVEKLL